MPASKAARVQASVWSRSTPSPYVSQEPSEISETSMSESPSRRYSMAATLTSVRLEPLGQLPRPAEGGAVAAVDLVRGHAQPLADDTAHPIHGEEPIVAAEQVFRR